MEMSYLQLTEYVFVLQLLVVSFGVRLDRLIEVHQQ